MLGPNDLLSELHARQASCVQLPCDGVDWMGNLVAQNPNITIGEAMSIAAADHASGVFLHQWAFELVFQQWAHIYPELRALMISMLPRPSAKYIALNFDGFTEIEKDALRDKLGDKIRARPELAAALEGKL